MKLDPVILTTKIEHKSSQTLLAFLSNRFHYHTSAEWTQRIQDGRVTVNGHQASEDQPLRAGDEVTYATTAWEEPEVKTDYRVVHEDEAILVLSKPAPLPVHAIGKYFRNTLMHILRKDRPEAKDFQLVHRLDSETSGLLLLVKDKKHLKPLLKQWQASGSVSSTLTPALSLQGRGGQQVDSEVPSPLEGEGRVRGEKTVRKTYLAIVFGKFEPGKRTVDAPIGDLPDSPIRMKLGVVEVAASSPSPLEGEGGVRGKDNAKPSITEFSLLESRGNFSLVEARPLTGRTHQIRVHLEHLGHPIVGDKLYSGNDETFLHFHEHGWDEWLKERVLLPRLALHAFKLEFSHPITGNRLVLEDPLPSELVKFWETLP